ncbi:hypothetical protein BGZ60DRAFT_163105 [Tricladium varicosporioides]|nr:hypothetical protein BGZ60DRAFT_163105 [Hymenoscyphus varicosporioides]
MTTQRSDILTANYTTFHTPHPFQTVISKLYSSIGFPSDVGKWKEVTKSITSYGEASQDAFVKEIENLVGPHGFMIFLEINHGQWTPLFLPSQPRLQCHRIILGNPLIAITMLKHDMNTGLFVPVEVLVREIEAGGCEVGYVVPSSLIVGSSHLDEYSDEKKELKKAAGVLDEKLEVLCRWICEE